MNHDELKEAIPAFALDAVSDYEEIKLSDHLELCDECAEIFEVHKQAASELALVAPPLQPSSDLRARILAGAEQMGQVVPIDVRSSLSEPRRWNKKISAILVAASLVSVGLFGGRMVKQIRDQNEQIERQGQAFAVVNSPEVQVVGMNAAAGVDGPKGQVFIPAETSGAAVLISGLDDPGRKTYALWAIRDGKPVPLQNFEPNEKGLAVLYIDKTIHSENPMAVTLEPREGTKTPQGPQVLSSI